MPSCVCCLISVGRYRVPNVNSYSAKFSVSLELSVFSHLEPCFKGQLQFCHKETVVVIELGTLLIECVELYLHSPIHLYGVVLC